MAQKTSKQNLFVTFLLFLGIYGGFLLGVRSINGLAFYDWDNTELIRRIEIQPKHVSSLHCFWNVHLCDELWVPDAKKCPCTLLSLFHCVGHYAVYLRIAYKIRIVALK